MPNFLLKLCKTTGRIACLSAVSLPLMLSAVAFAVDINGGVLIVTNKEPYSTGTVVSAGTPQVGKDAIAKSGTSATLHLSDGDYLAGELLACKDAEALRWQGAAFAAPLALPLSAISTVSFPLHPGATGRLHPNSPYCLELDGGDVLFGTLLGLSEKECRFDAAGLGVLHVERSAIQRIVHSSGAGDLVYLGPNGLLEWKPSPPGAWQQDAGRISTSQNGASIVGDLGLPKRACIDFEISWMSDPDFTLVLGARADSVSENNFMRLRAGMVVQRPAPMPRRPIRHSASKFLPAIWCSSVKRRKRPT